MELDGSSVAGTEPPGAGGSTGVTFHDDKHFQVGGCHFHLNYPVREVPPGRLPVLKTPAMVQDYIDLCRRSGARNVVELGIHSGGSTALLSELLHPRKLVAIELSEEPLAVLTDYIADHGVSDTVRPYYGVDQGDRPRLREIFDREFGDEPVDLVIDDASHYYEPTRASFEVLFPRLAVGGYYVIEDWRWEHHIATGLVDMIATDSEYAEQAAAAMEQAKAELAAGSKQKEVPFSRLVIQLFLGRADGHAVEEITINESWVVIRRGPGTFDRDTFTIADLYYDHFDQLDTTGGPPS